jgi:hypothetical protein
MATELATSIDIPQLTLRLRHRYFISRVTNTNSTPACKNVHLAAWLTVYISYQLLRLMSIEPVSSATARREVTIRGCVLSNETYMTLPHAYGTARRG